MSRNGNRIKNLKIVFLITILVFNFSQYIFAQDEYGQRRGRLKAFLEKRQTQNELQPNNIQLSENLNISYSGDSNPLKQLDVYFPIKNGEKLPVLVHFHGGGWKIGDKKRTKEHGIFYATHGVLFISVNYRLSPAIQHPVHVEDCAAAVAWVFKNLQDLGGDANRVFISGHSAGAHLAALLATDQQYLQKYRLQPGLLAGVIPVDAASFNLMSRKNERIVKQMITEAFGTNSEKLKSASPLYNISDKIIYPKFLILVSRNRKSAMTQTKIFTDRLKSVGCNAKFIVVKNHSHRDMNLGMHDTDDPVGKAILNFISNETKSTKH